MPTGHPDPGNDPGQRTPASLCKNRSRECRSSSATRVHSGTRPRCTEPPGRHRYGGPHEPAHGLARHQARRRRFTVHRPGTPKGAGRGRPRGLGRAPEMQFRPAQALRDLEPVVCRPKPAPGRPIRDAGSARSATATTAPKSPGPPPQAAARLSLTFPGVDGCLVVVASPMRRGVAESEPCADGGSPSVRTRMDKRNASARQQTGVTRPRKRPPIDPICPLLQPGGSRSPLHGKNGRSRSPG